MAKMHPFWWFKPPAVVCPEGEQVVNGGFETGDFTGWTCTDGMVQTTHVHTGTYAARVYPSGSRQLTQTLSTPVPVSCVITLILWYRNAVSGNSASARIGYSDGTYSEWVDMPVGAGWQEIDLIPYLTAGKTITEIEVLNGYISSLYVDDVSLISGE